MATKTVKKNTEVAKVVKTMKPYVTEKSGLLAERSNAFSFEIKPSDTKKTIAASVRLQYNVTPIKVNITKTPAKKVIVRGKVGSKKGHRKAVVYLKKGDKIEFI